MTATELLRVLESQDVQIRVDREDLVLSNHYGKIPSGLLEQLKAQKTAVIALLRADAQPAWIRERNLDPESVAEAFQRYATDRPGETQQHLSVGTLLSGFNLWLEEQGQRPTTLPVLREAMGIPSASKPLRAEIARCLQCGGTDWGSSGRHTGDGAEVWRCLVCVAENIKQKGPS